MCEPIFTGAHLCNGISAVDNCSGSWMLLTHKDKTATHVEWETSYFHHDILLYYLAYSNTQHCITLRCCCCQGWMIGLIQQYYHLSLQVNSKLWFTSHDTKSFCFECLTLFDGNVSGIGGCHKTGLRQRILQRKELILGHCVGPGLEDGTWSDGGKVKTLSVAKSYETAVVLARKVTVLKVNNKLTWESKTMSKIMFYIVEWVARYSEHLIFD